MNGSDPEQTDIIPGLRPTDTPPMGTPFPPRHRRAGRASMPRAAAVALLGTPTAAAALATGLLLPGWLSNTPPPTAVPGASESPTPTQVSPSRVLPREDEPAREPTTPPTLSPSATRSSTSPASTAPSTPPAPSPARSVSATSAPPPSSPPESSPPPSDESPEPTDSATDLDPNDSPSPQEP